MNYVLHIAKRIGCHHTDTTVAAAGLIAAEATDVAAASYGQIHI